MYFDWTLTIHWKDCITPEEIFPKMAATVFLMSNTHLRKSCWHSTWMMGHTSSLLEPRQEPLWWTWPAGTGQRCNRACKAKVMNIPHTSALFPWEVPSGNSATARWGSPGDTEGPLQVSPARQTHQEDASRSCKPSAFTSFQIRTRWHGTGTSYSLSLLRFLTHRVLEHNVFLISATNLWDGLLFTNYALGFCPGTEN